ncbi:regulatory protein RecX [Alloprevotella tannerae]|uniref:regulatory protein RecX n=1 Tax=Alloprevotella tannerae TaxID=76122 RepID=UPI0028E204A6|nr:regulatory protein RecX [Alloprevotella tannerae]
MKEKVSSDALYKRAATRCAQREYCRSDWARKFIEAGLTLAEAEGLLDRLEAEKYIDEARYAKAFVHDKTLYDRWGRFKTRQALALKGIESGLIDAALAEIDDAAYTDTLKDLLVAKRRSVKAGSDYEMQQKLIRYAAGRGFEADLIFKVLETD